MPRPKPSEPRHQFHLRIPQSLYLRLADRAEADGRSINATVRGFCEAALLGSPIVIADTQSGDVFPWTNTEE